MIEPKIFIGPMSKNVVDMVCDLNKEFPIGLIPSRRQIEHDGGYVNNWDTLNFHNYVKSRNPNVILCRDHAGPGQGKVIDDGYESLKHDCLTMDIIHIDPWKTITSIEQAAEITCRMITSCYQYNPQMLYEIGTEEAIYKYHPGELDDFISTVNQNLPNKIFKQIKYAVVQSGTGLDLPNGKNTGVFDGKRLKSFINIVKKWGLLSKEHNGDFLVPNNGIKTRFDLGLDAINIAPEFGQIETEQYLYNIIKDNNERLKSKLWKICFDSKKWEKWVIGNQISENQLIMTTGHYILNTSEFIKIKSNYPDIDTKIREIIKHRIYEIHTQTENHSL